jgi:dTMP kinase
MFITFEGIEGSGKTTQIQHVAGFLASAGYDCVVTKEPGGTPIGEKIRAILLNPEHKGLHPAVELFLYSADRVQHVTELIAPALDAGRVVICDRFHDSTTVYQGVSRGMEMEWVNRLNRMAIGGFLPDVTFVLDLPPRIGLERAWRQIKNGMRSSAETRFEKEKLAFHERVRNGYLELARFFPDRIVVINASVLEKEVTESILKELKRRFKIYK